MTDPLAHYKPATTLGVELEFFLPNNHIVPFIEALHAQFPRWNMSSDHSLVHTDGNMCGVEVKSPILRSGLDTIGEVARLALSMGGEVNDTCGLHVHLGINNTFTERERFPVLRQFAANYVGHEPEHDPRVRQHSEAAMSFQTMIRDYEGPDTRAEGTAAIAACQNLDELKYQVNPGKTRKGWSLNLNALKKYGTVEARQARGTLDPKEITDWVLHLDKLMALSVAQVRGKAPGEHGDTTGATLWTEYVTSRQPEHALVPSR